jgi:hypothetical protein
MSITHDCPKGGCGGTMAINKKGIYVCPDCGFTATYCELHPDEDRITVSDKIDVSQFVEMRKQRDHVLTLLRDTELVLFQPVIKTALRYLVRGMEGRDKPTVFLGNESLTNIDILEKAKKKRPTMT